MQQFIIHLTNNPSFDNRSVIRKKVYDYIKQNPFCSRDDIASFLNIDGATVAAAIEFLNSNNIIRFNKSTSKDGNGKFLTSEKIVLMDLVLSFGNSLSKCRLCGTDVVKLKKSKHKDLCLDCTKKIFMSPSVKPCTICGKQLLRRERRTKKGKLYCKDCLPLLFVKKEKMKVCVDCGGRYKEKCNNFGCKTFICLCGNECKRIDAFKKGKLFCSKDCYVDSLSFEQDKFPKTIRDLFERKCGICGYDKILDYHHITEVCEGGKTTVENCIPLCPNHHREYHAGLLSKDEIITARSRVKLLI